MVIRKETKFKLISFFSILAIGIVSMLGLSATNKKSAKIVAKPEIRKVETLELKYENITPEIEGNGVIAARRTLEIVAEVRGIITFAKNDLKSGTFFNEGELICEIDPRQAVNEVHSLRSDLMKMITSFLAYTKLEDEKMYAKWLKYFNSLTIDNTVPDLPEIIEPREKILISNYNIFAQYFTVKNAEILLSKHEIYAPFAGFITSNAIIQGSYVSVGQKVAIIRDVKNIEISVPLLLDDSKWIDLSNQPEVKIFWDDNPENWVTGIITRQDSRLDRDSQSINIYIYLQNPSLNHHLFPGNYVHVLIRGITIFDVAKIPRHTIDGLQQIYFVDENNKLGKQPIEIILVQKDFALIKRSLPDNTKIISTLLQKPLVGMPVQDINDVSSKIFTKDSLNTELDN